MINLVILLITSGQSSDRRSRESFIINQTELILWKSKSIIIIITTILNAIAIIIVTFGMNSI